MSKNSRFYFLNTLNVGLLILNKEREVIFINDWLKDRLKEGSIEVGAPLEYDENDCGRFHDSLLMAIKHGRSVLLTTRLNRMPFDLFHGKIKLSYNLSISRASDSDLEESKSVVIQFLDVTQVKEREKYINDKQKVIDTQAERSIHQEKLSALGELTTSIAHEINNPLAILETNTKLLESMLEEKQVYDDNFKEVIGDAYETIRRIEKLVDSVKDLAYVPKSEDFEPDTLKNVIDPAKTVFMEKAKNIGVELKYDETKPIFNTPIEVNKTLLTQVFVNLLNNSYSAIKDLDEKWIEIDGELFSHRLIIHFTDSGSGIPKDIQEKIFLPFFTTKDIGEGTGLGLSTTQKIVESHLGTMTIDTSCTYTRFSISLPLKHL